MNPQYGQLVRGADERYRWRLVEANTNTTIKVCEDGFDSREAAVADFHDNYADTRLTDIVTGEDL